MLCTLCLGVGPRQVRSCNMCRDDGIGIIIGKMSQPDAAHQDTDVTCSIRRNCGQSEKLITPRVLQPPMDCHSVDHSQRQEA